MVLIILRLDAPFELWAILGLTVMARVEDDARIAVDSDQTEAFVLEIGDTHFVTIHAQRMVGAIWFVQPGFAVGGVSVLAHITMGAPKASIQRDTGAVHAVMYFNCAALTGMARIKVCLCQLIELVRRGHVGLTDQIRGVFYPLHGEGV